MTGSRKIKTPQQRAEETLGVARRAAARAHDKLAKVRLGIADAEQEWNAARTRLAYVASDPDLPEGVGTEALEWIDEQAEPREV